MSKCSACGGPSDSCRCVTTMAPGALRSGGIASGQLADMLLGLVPVPDVHVLCGSVALNYETYLSALRTSGAVVSGAIFSGQIYNPATPPVEAPRPTWRQWLFGGDTSR